MEIPIDAISARVPHPESEYLSEEDGLLHCSKCHKKVQTVVYLPWLKESKTVRCICDCIKAERDAYRERERLYEQDQIRKHCFAETDMKSWSFENDDRKNAKLSDAMMRYAENFQNYRKDGKGLLLFGDIGTGKTYYAACIANRLIDEGFRVKMTNFARLTNQLQGMFEGKQEYIDSLNRYDLLIIDDLGAERKSEFMQEMVFNIIDSRYRAGLPMIITTNLTAEEIKKPQEVSFSRIYDRILERCFPIKVEGASRRRIALKESFDDMKNELGL